MRYLEAIGFVAAWMMLGAGLRFAGLADAVVANSYLLIGIPLMMLFQCYVRKERLITLWVRDAQRFHLGISGFLAAMVFAIMPTYALAKNDWPASLRIVGPIWLIAGIVGAFGAGFCLRHTPPRTLLKGLPGFLVASAIGLLIVGFAAIARGKPLWASNTTLSIAQQFLLYFPVCFAIEEVVFRGMLDAHLHDPAARRGPRWLSAVIVSVLWGLWHLPVVPIPDIDMLSAIIIVPGICVPHVLIGVPLSFCCRSSGSLLLPCAAHALIDAFRNAVLM